MAIFKHLDRYKDLVWLLVKYGRSDIVKNMGVETPPQPDNQIGQVDIANEFAKDLEKLGPTFIKLGQLFSTQFEIIPPPFQEALEKLQDRADPFSFTLVEKIFYDELHVKIKDAFLEFNPQPIAAASISQVHQAILRDGRMVAVKVQRPDIQEKIAQDLEVLIEIADYIDTSKLLNFPHFYWKEKVTDFKKVIYDELNFKKEARNLQRLKKNLQNFDLIVIPSPIIDFTSTKVLTMEYISSKKITSLHPLIQMEIDGKSLATELFEAYFKQIFVDGFLHSDPHPGNVYLTDTSQIALLDLGMVDFISHQMQQDLLQLVLAIIENRGEDVTDILIKIGHAEPGFEKFSFKKEICDLVASSQDLSWEEFGFGRLLLRVATIASQKGLKLSHKLNILAKVLTSIDSIMRTLAPDLDPGEVVRKNISDLLSEKVKKLLSIDNFYNGMLNIIQIAQKIPSKTNELIEKISNEEFKIKLESFNENRLMEGFEKVANRIAAGLVLASLVIGAALLMRIETAFTILGYPGISMLFFIGAACGGVIFLINIIRNDVTK